MTELDLGLKAISRRLLWRMGFSTRIDVVLRALRVTAPPTSRTARAQLRGAAPEAFTDLDVLGIAVTSSAGVRSSIVDCKTGGSSIISRMFWLRGLADFFEADDAYMVRDRAISKDARQLASRLHLKALTESEVTSLEKVHQQTLPLESAPLSLLFDPDYIARVIARTSKLDRRLDPLLDYRQFDYWVYPEHRNLIEMVEVLNGAKGALDGNSPIHTGILIDCAWLYVLSAAHCLSYLRAVHISDLSYGLSEYLAGGTAQLNQKRDLANLLEQLRDTKQIPEKVKVSVNPRYFAELLELLIRLLRRTEALTDVLRVLEFQSTMSIGGDKVPAERAFGNQYNRVAAKLAVDVVAFLVAAADLDPTFTSTTRELLIGTDPEALAQTEALTPKAAAPSQSNGGSTVADNPAIRASGNEASIALELGIDDDT
ncbi:hypothetical protein [Agromyces ramosus]|uniref:Uncharacterized protein n=1 Tax=Agromyces ramosus TaxID=33879 RepID=A0ABU0R608_9MICO|nr:hypothetical protein [Agromyces ramosus]MDQ0893498.1 hypothetical protein [Agromyces ramosus]